MTTDLVTVELIISPACPGYQEQMQPRTEEFWKQAHKNGLVWLREHNHIGGHHDFNPVVFGYSWYACLFLLHKVGYVLK
jgi:hypothetical protein